MKLAAIYNVFDSEELLEGSIKQIYDHVDYVCIVYQTQSNKGVNYDLQEGLLHSLKHQYPKIRLKKCHPDLAIKPQIIGQVNERTKRSLGVQMAHALGCTHFLLMDCDEYYDTEQFAAAKDAIVKNGWDATKCSLYTYYKEPTYQLDPIEDYLVPFICEIKEGMVLGPYFEKCDPTRGMKPVKNLHTFDRSELMMHHYSWVRKNMWLKVSSSSANLDYHKELKAFEDWQLGQAPHRYPKHKIKEVENKFGIFI